MKPADFEAIEQYVMELVAQALSDYMPQAGRIFREETDLPQDIAEDITREALEAMGASGFNERLYGKVDFKKAIYVFLPEPAAVAMMVDTKAEKSNGDRTATIQMSQTSMTVRIKRSKTLLEEPGKLERFIVRGDRRLYVVTVVVKFIYEEARGSNHLLQVVVACIPNGELQDMYNPSAEDTIWQVGRDAPTRGEDFRVRLSFSKLRKKASWRVKVFDV